MLDWLLDGIFSWLAERIQGLLGSLLGFMTSAFFTTADVTTLPQVQALATRSATVVDALFALAVIAAGGLGMTHGSVQIRYELKDLVPRLVVGFVASSFGVALCAGIIQVANAVTTTLVGQAAAGPRVVTFVKTGMAAAILDPAVRALVAIIALIIVVLFFQLLLSAFLRVLTLLIVAGIAPVALACYALPHTQSVAQLWWRVLLGALVTPMLQAVAFSAGVDLLLDPAHNLPNMIGIPGLPGSAMTTVANLVMVACLLLLTVRIPRLVTRYALRGGSATSPLAVMVRAVVIRQMLH